jgi:hypothetical protein
VIPLQVNRNSWINLDLFPAGAGLIGPRSDRREEESAISPETGRVGRKSAGLKIGRILRRALPLGSPRGDRRFAVVGAWTVVGDRRERHQPHDHTVPEVGASSPKRSVARRVVGRASQRSVGNPGPVLEPARNRASLGAPLWVCARVAAAAPAGRDTRQIDVPLGHHGVPFGSGLRRRRPSREPTFRWNFQVKRRFQLRRR